MLNKYIINIFHFPLTIFCTFANEQFKYEVNAYVRNPQKLQIENKNLEVFVGQVSDYDKIKETIAGCDAVIIALGIFMKFGYEDTSSIIAHKNIVKAMNETNVKRLIDWSTPSIKFKDDRASLKYKEAV